MPDYNLIIECDGLNTHTIAVKKDKYYHYDKKELYAKNNFDFFAFFEQDIYNNHDIIESMIIKKIGLLDSLQEFKESCFIKDYSHDNQKVDHFFKQNCLEKIYYPNFSNLKSIILISGSQVVAAIEYVKDDNYLNVVRFANRKFIKNDYLQLIINEICQKENCWNVQVTLNQMYHNNLDLPGFIQVDEFVDCYKVHCTKYLVFDKNDPEAEVKNAQDIIYNYGNTIWRNFN